MLGFPITLLLRIEAIGFPTFGLLLYCLGSSGLRFGVEGSSLKFTASGLGFHDLRVSVLP